MTKEKIKQNTKPFYKTANALLKMPIKTVEDVKNFYIGINNLASEISSNQDLIKKLEPFIYNDDRKLFREVTHTLGYGLAVEDSKMFSKTKKIKINSFLKKIPQTEGEIINVKQEAKKYFDTFKKFTKAEKETIAKIARSEIKSIQSALLEEEKNKNSLLITRNEDNNEYYLNKTSKPRLLKLKKTALYFLAFETMYSLVPEGGTITFSDFIGGAPNKIKKRLLKKKYNQEKCKIIRSYLTDKSNGFLRASKIGGATFNEKPLIECDLVIGITFNNKK